ncbi:MAG TPA: phosphatidylglycerol lysyltransferase domain-containing protein [Dermatophilaceae bacterium]|nr:phosphatidylglycerol lysyltransferase domain-containing protein [Dermatophilaceae bacterium]
MTARGTTPPRVTGPPAPVPPSRSVGHDSKRAPRVLGNVTYIIGAVDVLTGLLHSWRVRLAPVTDILPGALSDAAAAATVVSGVLLLILGHSLKRRKRRAWRAAVGLLAASLLLHVAKAEVAPALLSLAGVALMVRHRDAFPALGDPGTRWRAVRALVILLAVSLVVGVAAVWMARGDVVGGPPSAWPTLRQVGAGLVGAEGPLRFTSDRAGDVLGSLLLGLGLMTALVTAYLVLRPPEPRPGASVDDEVRLCALLDRHPDSLAYFSLRSDKGVVWSPSGKAGVVYRVVSGVALSSGDPIGDPEAWPGAMAAFTGLAEAYAWTPAVLGCSERAGRVWVRETGAHALELGDEAVLDATTFALTGRPMRNVRQMVGRVERAGYVTEVLRVRDVADAVRRRALVDAAAWRGSDTERGFSMALGRLLDDRDGDCVFAAARQDGVVRAFLQLVPWGRDGLSLDVMRWDRDADRASTSCSSSTSCAPRRVWGCAGCR